MSLVGPISGVGQRPGQVRSSLNSGRAATAAARPFRADIVEEVGGLTVWDGARVAAILASRPGRRRRSPAPGSHRTWRADFPHHALRQLVHSFHCYLFKFRFHGQLIFSLRPDVSAALTTVAFDQSRPRWLGISDLIAEPEGPTFISYKVARSRLNRPRLVTKDPEQKF